MSSSLDIHLESDFPPPQHSSLKKINEPIRWLYFSCFVFFILGLSFFIRLLVHVDPEIVLYGFNKNHINNHVPSNQLHNTSSDLASSILYIVVSERPALLCCIVSFIYSITYFFQIKTSFMPYVSYRMFDAILDSIVFSVLLASLVEIVYFMEFLTVMASYIIFRLLLLTDKHIEVDNTNYNEALIWYILMISIIEFWAILWMNMIASWPSITIGKKVGFVFVHNLFFYDMFRLIKFNKNKLEYYNNILIIFESINRFILVIIVFSEEVGNLYD